MENKYKDISVQDAINSIKQNRLEDITPEDMLFLRENEEKLSEADKAMYFDGLSPREAYEKFGFTPLTAAERIIAENRHLQDIENAQRASKNYVAPKMDVNDEEVKKNWKETINSLNKEADKVEKHNKEPKKEVKS